MKQIAFIISMMAMVACGGRATPVTDTVDTVGPAESDAPQYTLEENIGQMLLVGFRGTEMDSTKNPEIISALRDYHVGSVILFDYDVASGKRGRNIQSDEQLRKLCSQLRS